MRSVWTVTPAEKPFSAISAPPREIKEPRRVDMSAHSVGSCERVAIAQNRHRFVSERAMDLPATLQGVGLPSSDESRKFILYVR